MPIKKKSDSDQAFGRALTASGARMGLSVFLGSDLAARARAAIPLPDTDQSPIARAVRAKWPDSHPEYWRMIVRRYTELFYRLPEEDAVHAIREGFSSPVTAMRARVIRRRRFIDFPEHRE